MRRPARAPREAEADVGTVSVRAVDRLLDIGVAAGLPRSVLLDAAGVTDAELRDSDARLPLAADIALWQAFAKRISDPGFGVRAGAALRVRQLGLLGYVVSFSATLRGALRRVQRYGRVFTEAVTFEFQEGRAPVAFAMGHPALGPGQAYAQDYRLASVLQVGREVTGVDIVPVEVRFPHPQPASTLAHRRHFRCSMRFGAPSASIVFRAADLDLPLLRGDETLAGYLGEYAERVLASLVEGQTMRHAARAAVWSVLSDGKPSLARVAAALQVAPRTLQHRLAAEGTSLHREIEAIRKTMAIAALRDPSASIDDIVFLLGYAEASSFFRSFKRWTGTTPHNFRRDAA